MKPVNESVSLQLKQKLAMENIKKILVPTDFSPNATKALDYAVQLSKKAKAEIFIIHSVESGMTDGEAKDVPGKLDLLTKSIEKSEKIKVTNKVYTGISLYAILDSIEEFKIDLVVMGTLGNAKASKKIFGSRTASVIGKSPVPVLAIPLLSEWGTGTDIMLAINDFKIEDKTLDPVILLARCLNSAIQVAIFTDTDDDYVEDYDEHEKKIASFRDALKKKYPGLEFQAVHLASKHFKDSVLSWIEKNKISMLVMLTHKRNIIEGIFNRSLTKKLSYHTNIPLLAIPL